MFTGKVREERKVTLGGKKRNADQKNNKEIVDEARKLREIRAIERLRLESSIKIQRVTRGFIIRKHFFSSLQSEFDSKVSYINKLEDVFKAKKAVFVVPNESLLSLANQLIWFSNYNESCVSYYTNSSSSLKGTKNNSNSYNTINNNDRRLIALQSLLTNSINSDQSKTNLLATITNDQLTNSPFANNNNFLRVVLKIFLLSARRFLFVLIDNSYENRHQMNISELIPSLHGLLQALSPINSTTTTLFETQKRFIGIVLMHDFFELVRKSSIALKLNKSVKTDDRIRSSISSIVKVAYGLVSDGIQFSLTSANTNVAIIDKVITGYRNVNMSKIVVSIMSMSALEDYQEILALLQMMNSPVHQQAISSVHDILPSISSVANYSPISQKYPFVYRDLAALLKKNIAIGVEGEARINFLANHCSYFLNNRLHAVPSLGVKWLTATDQLLRSGGIPLINLLRYHAYEYPLDSPKFSLLEYTPAQIEELNHLYSIVSASKKLEYRIMSMQTELRRMEDRAWHDITLHDQGYSLNRIIKFFTDKSTVISLLSGCLDQTQHINRSEESMDIVVEQKGMTGIISALSLYGTLLMCAPTGLDSYPPDSSDSMEVVHAKVSAYSNYITHDVIGDILNTMAFSFPSVPLVTKLWCLLKTEFASIISVVVDQDMDVCLRSAEFKELAANLEVSIDDLYHAFHCTLFMICSVMSYQLVAIDDQELLVYCKILPLDDIVELMMLLKRWLYKLYWTYPVVDTTMHFLEVQPGCSRNHLVVLHCQYAATKLFNSMCYRNERRKFIDTEDLYWSGVSAFDLAIVENEEAANNKNDSPIESGDTFSFKNLKAKAILTFLPQVIPFKLRVSIFQALVQKDKSNYFGQSSNRVLAEMGFGGAIRVQVRRDNILKDSFVGLSNAGRKLKGRVQVEFISEQGLAEAGIDGGGLFKEYLDALTKSAFNPKSGLFKPTSSQLLTPNPQSLVVEDHLQYFNFIGKILGKALYEGILLEPEFAGGFLNVLLGRSNQLDDLYYLDEQFYRSLMNLKQFASTVESIDDMELYFQTTDDPVVELIPNGSNTKVDKGNLHQYIHRLAYYKQNTETADQSKAFLSGFREMIPIEWLRMFNTKELQLLISGDRRAIDIDDMKRHTHYGSGYHESQPYIQAFWKIIEEMSTEDQGNFLRFVTSCSRQPLMGFGTLNPTFAVQKIPTNESFGSARLPSAATCMNLLKLPQYNSIELLKEKLLYAIRSNSGFELS